MHDYPFYAVKIDRTPDPDETGFLRRKGLVERMADADTITDVRGKGHRATFGRLREEEARKSVRNPDRARRG